jgi:hypothetical protein
VTFQEDAGRVHSGNALQMLGVLRNVVIHLLAGVDADSHPEALDLLQLHPEQARELIGIP